jgi:hypothetical protein
MATRGGSERRDANGASANGGERRSGSFGVSLRGVWRALAGGVRVLHPRGASARVRS